MSDLLLPTLKQHYTDSNGLPLAGGQLFSYLAGTSTPAATYTDSTGATPNANPIILDSRGEANVWIPSSTLYKFILQDANGVVQFTVDNVSTILTAAGAGPWVTHSVNDGQAASNLVGQTFDFASFSSAIYDCEIIRGTTVISTGRLAIQNLNSVGQVLLGEFFSNQEHGITFSVTQVGTVIQLQAALDVSAGNGTIKLQRQLVPK